MNAYIYTQHVYINECVDTYTTCSREYVRKSIHNMFI